MWLRVALSTGLMVAASAWPLPAVADTGSLEDVPQLVLSVPPAAATEDAVLQATVDETHQILAHLGIRGDITSRRKSAYSTWMKMHRKGVTMDQVLDRLAIRVHVDEEAECYAVLDALHGRFSFRDDAFTDYIANPKTNGYASLHTVLDLDGPVEVQIRTHAMHHHAEHGTAAHALYKQGQGFDIAV